MYVEGQVALAKSREFSLLPALDAAGSIPVSHPISLLLVVTALTNYPQSGDPVFETEETRGSLELPGNLRT